MPQITITGARKNMGLTQSELAEKLGVSLAAVQKWESGKCDVRFSHMKKISELSGFSLDDFILPKEYAQSVQR